MDSFEIINTARLQHGYNAHQFKSYKKYCNKIKRTNKNQENNMHSLFAMESNLAKFRMFNSRRYLYNALRIIKKDKSLSTEFIKVYGQYIQCFIDSDKNCLDIDKLVDLRSKLAEYYAFLNDIYLMNDNRHDFDQYKVKYQWNDVTITFETEKVLESFKNGTFCFKDFRFNTQLANKALNVDKCMKVFTDAVISKDDILKVHEMCTKLNNSVGEISRFLTENFVESNYVEQLKVQCSSVLAFIQTLIEYRNGIITENIKPFKCPSLFVKISNDLNVLNQEKTVESKKLKASILDIIEKRMEVDSRPRKMPFLPVFYDLAYDYIDYPNENTEMAQKLQGFSFFKK